MSLATLELITTPSRNTYQPRHALDPSEELPTYEFDRIVAVKVGEAAILSTNVIDPLASPELQPFLRRKYRVPERLARLAVNYFSEYTLDPPVPVSPEAGGFDYDHNCHHAALHICAHPELPPNLEKAEETIVSMVAEAEGVAQLDELPASGTHIVLCGVDGKAQPTPFHSVVVLDPGEETFMQVTSCGGVPSLVQGVEKIDEILKAELKYWDSENGLYVPLDYDAHYPSPSSPPDYIDLTKFS